MSDLRAALVALAEWPCQKYNPPHDCGRVTGNAPLPCGPCTARAALEAEPPVTVLDVLHDIEKAVLRLDVYQPATEDGLPWDVLDRAAVLAAIRAAAPVKPT